MGKNYWMIVESLENYEITRNLGFTVYGVGLKFRRRAQRMQPEDQILFYISALKKWTSTAIIKSSYYTDNTTIWKPHHGEDKFPFRVKIEPDIVLHEDDYIDASMLAPRLEYVRRWVPEDWPLAFFDKLHLIPQKDFRLIEGEMQRLQSRRPGGSSRNHKKRKRLFDPRSQASSDEHDMEMEEPDDYYDSDETEDQSATEDSSTDVT
jgi:predicted RNA-binding protein